MPETLLKQSGSTTKPHFKKQKGKSVNNIGKNPPECCSSDVEFKPNEQGRSKLRIKITLNSKLFDNKHALGSMKTLQVHALNDKSVVIYVRIVAMFTSLTKGNE